MELSNLKDIFNDRVKAAYISSFTVILLLAYTLLVRIDFGKFRYIQLSLSETDENLAILKKIAEYTEDINKFNSKFVIKDEGTNWLIGTVTDVAKSSNIKLDLTKPAESTASYAGYKKVSVLVEGKASYHDMAKFISGIESNEKYLVIEEFELRAEDVSQAERIASFKAIITCFNSEK